MKTISFTIYQEPTGKKAVMHTKTGIAYHSKEQKYNESYLIEEMEKHRPLVPIGNPMILCINAFFPIPKSKPKWWKEAALAGYIKFTKKPDCDNCWKQVGDALEKMQFIENDCKIYAGRVAQWYSDRPRWEIRIEIFPEMTREMYLREVGNGE